MNVLAPDSIVNPAYISPADASSGIDASSGYCRLQCDGEGSQRVGNTYAKPERFGDQPGRHPLPSPMEHVNDVDDAYLKPVDAERGDDVAVERGVDVDVECDDVTVDDDDGHVGLIDGNREKTSYFTSKI